MTELVHRQNQDNLAVNREPDRVKYTGRQVQQIKIITGAVSRYITEVEKQIEPNLM